MSYGGIFHALPILYILFIIIYRDNLKSYSEILRFTIYIKCILHSKNDAYIWRAFATRIPDVVMASLAVAARPRRT